MTGTKRKNKESEWFGYEKVNPQEKTDRVLGVFRKLAAKYAHFHFIPLLSETPDDRLRSGTLAQALETDFDSLSGYAVFMAGPTGMVEATAPFLLDKGLEKDFLFCDSFG